MERTPDTRAFVGLCGGVLQSPALTRRLPKRRADQHPAALLPAEPTLARRREDCTETPSHFLRVRPSARRRPRRRNRRRRLPDSLAHVNRQKANAECGMMNDEWKAVASRQ